MKSPKNMEKKDSSLKDGARNRPKNGDNPDFKIIESDVIRPEVQDAWDNNKPLPDLHGYGTTAELALFQEYGE